jgi:hypothetical protein
MAAALFDGSKPESKSILSRIDEMDKAFSGLLTEFDELKNKLDPMLKSELLSGETCSEAKSSSYLAGRSPSNVALKIENFVQAMLALQEDIREIRLRVDV